MKTNIIPTPNSVEIKSGSIEFSELSMSVSLLKAVPADIILEDFNLQMNGSKPVTAIVDENLAKEEYRLVVSESKAEIFGGSPAGIHHGFVTLVQLAALNDGKIDCCEIFDKPQMDFRAVSDDISRGQISTIDGFKSIVRRISYFKYNVYMPYIEDTFKFRFCPDFGKYSDPVPAEEWKDLCEYAEAFGVSVRPIINLLGHWDKNAVLYDFRDMMLQRDGKPLSCLDVTKPSVMKFINNMLDEVIDAFGPGVVHVGGDEASEMKSCFGEEKGSEIFVKHFNTLNAELKKRGCTMMMYADMFVPVWGDYSFKFEAVEKLDKDIELIFWDYAPRDEYKGVDKLAENNLKFGVSPASWSWNRFIPQFEVSFINCKNLLRQALGKTSTYILSSWNDGGCGLREEMMPGIAAGGQFSWKYDDGIEFDSFFENFCKIYYGYEGEVTAAMRAIFDYDKIFKVNDIHEYAAMGSELFNEFWKDARQLTSTAHELPEKCTELISVIGEAEDVLKHNKPLRNKPTYDAFMFDTRRLLWVCMRACVIPTEKFECREDARSIVDDLIPLSEEFELIKKENKRLWFRQNRQSEWNLLESRYIDTEQSLYSFIRNCKFAKRF